MHKWKWRREKEHKLWLIMIDSSWWQTEIMTQRLENYCLVIFLFLSRFATGWCRAVIFRFRRHGFIFNFTSFFNGFLFLSFDFLLLFLFILLYLWPWRFILSIKVSHNFQFRWLKTKAIYAAFPIPIMIFSNHLK